MSKEKKLLIATILLGVMFPLSVFGLSLITEAFLILGVFCGIGALLCFMVYLDLKAGKKPKLIPIGLGMTFFGFAFLGISDFYQAVTIPSSALFAVAGLVIFWKGIKERRDARRNPAPKVKQPMNTKIYIGIGLLVGGFAATFILFSILPLLMSIGHVMIIVGLVFLGRGLADRKNGSTRAKATRTQPARTVTAKPVEVVCCTRCGKNLAYLSDAQTHIIDGEKYCADCKTAMEQDQKNQHTVCSVCGVDLPLENMHVIDDALMCHTCFLKRYGNIDDYMEDATGSTLDTAVVSLRNQIITEITKRPAIEYQLASLLWQDAANCFPNSGFRWDGAWFKLDLQTGKLWADVGTYPNQFGASYEDSFPLSATEFHRMATQFNMSKDLQVFVSDEDWGKLFDDHLKSAVAFACAILKKQDESRKNEEIKKNAVQIPAKYAKQTPTMCFSEITLEIRQRYSDRSINVLNDNGHYQIVYVRNSHTSPDVDKDARTLSAAEAVWLEKQVEKAIKNPDESTWQSLPGGDTMSIVIKRNNGKDISLGGQPIRKYSALQNELEKLARYGSLADH